MEIRLETLAALHVLIKQCVLQDMFDINCFELILEYNVWIFTGSKKIWIFFHFIGACTMNYLWWSLHKQKTPSHTWSLSSFFSNLNTKYAITFWRACSSTQNEVVKKAESQLLAHKWWTCQPDAASTNKKQVQTARRRALRAETPLRPKRMTTWLDTFPDGL